MHDVEKERRRTSVSFVADALPETFPTAAEASGVARGEGVEFGGFRLGEEEFVEVAYLERRMERMFEVRESIFDVFEDSPRVSDAEKLGPGHEANDLRLDGFVLDL